MLGCRHPQHSEVGNKKDCCADGDMNMASGKGVGFCEAVIAGGQCDVHWERHQIEEALSDSGPHHGSSSGMTSSPEEDCLNNVQGECVGGHTHGEGPGY